MAVTESHSDSRAFLGTGWRFPIQVTPRGRIALARAEERIEQSIYLILSTSRGERVMLADFGAGIHDQVFAPNNSITLNMVATGVREALLKYEPRIDVLGVDVSSSPEEPSLLLIRISYKIRATNAVGNMVYPFYINEAA